MFTEWRKPFVALPQVAHHLIQAHRPRSLDPHDVASRQDRPDHINRGTRVRARHDVRMLHSRVKGSGRLHREGSYSHKRLNIRFAYRVHDAPVQGGRVGT